MFRLFLASTITLGLLSSFVAGIVILAMIYTDVISIPVAIVVTVGVNFLLWLVGPWFTDLVNKWFHGVKFMSKEEVEKAYPHVAELINQICSEYKFKFPKFGVIGDKNPTAFTYGSARFNARVVVTEGIFHFLNKKEQKAVIAHEMGHVVNRDFIVMMVASTLLQILYEIYAILIKAKGKKAGSAKAIAMGAYVLYVIGIYLVYYLSRTREYLADTFSTKYTDAKDLANALIKIAYGIVAEPDDHSSQRLLGATRHLGIVDVKNAKHMGMVSYITHNDKDAIADVMVFDKMNPWAKLAELNSTHPLTGNRINHLCCIAKQQGQPFDYDVEGAARRMNIDKGRLWRNFIAGVCVLALPVVLAIPIAFVDPLLVPAAVGLGLLLQIPYKFPFREPEKTTIVEEMRNPYASLVRGKPIEIEGKVIGRGSAGYIFDEDMMYQDKTGLIFMNYSSIFGWIGNLFFALGKIKKLFDKPSKASGWFYRGMGSMLALKYVKTDDVMARSHPIFWSLVLPILLIIVTVVLEILLRGGFV